MVFHSFGCLDTGKQMIVIQVTGCAEDNRPLPFLYVVKREGAFAF